MKFVKLKIGNDIQWRLVITNQEDLLIYGKIDAEKNFESYLHTDDNQKLVVGSREHTISRLMDLGISSLKEGEQKSPMLILADFQDRKILSMLKTLKLGELCINQSGGYCTLDGFIDQHKAEILETLYKDDIGIPNESYIGYTDLILLENDQKVDPSFIKELENMDILTEKTKYTIFNNLKLQDRNHVFKSIEKTKTIVAQTQAIDIDQIDIFIKMFLMLNDKKNIIIKTFNKEALINHKNYNNLIIKHKVQFI